jgi:phage shock protein A
VKKSKTKLTRVQKIRARIDALLAQIEKRRKKITKYEMRLKQAQAQAHVAKKKGK